MYFMYVISMRKQTFAIALIMHRVFYFTYMNILNTKIIISTN